MSKTVALAGDCVGLALTGRGGHKRVLSKQATLAALGQSGFHPLYVTEAGTPPLSDKPLRVAVITTGHGRLVRDLLQPLFTTVFPSTEDAKNAYEEYYSPHLLRALFATSLSPRRTLEATRR